MNKDAPMLSMPDVFSVVSRALELPEDFELRPETEIDVIPGWDSLGWVAVIVAIEAATEQEFPVAHIERIKTLEQLFHAL